MSVGGDIKRKRKQFEREVERARERRERTFKVHCRRPGVAHKGSAWCGVLAINHAHIVEPWIWDWLPASAFCGSCARSIDKPNGLRDSWLRPQGITSRAELEIAIETALHQLAAHMQTWPDAWHVDPHGTGNNPHVLFRGSFDEEQACPCGYKQVLFTHLWSTQP